MVKTRSKGAGTDKETALHLAMMEAKKRSGLSQSAIARRLGMPQPNVSRIEHSEVVSFNTFADYLMACGFGFTIYLRPIANRSMGGKKHEEGRLER